MWIFITLWTQFLDPPKWSDEINAWVTSKRTAEVLDGDGTDGSTCREGSPVSHLSETAQNAFFVTSRNEDGLAIWPVGTNEGPLADDDDDMSSVSDEYGEGKDLEKDQLSRRTLRFVKVQQVPSKRSKRQSRQKNKPPRSNP